MISEILCWVFLLSVVSQSKGVDPLDTICHKVVPYDQTYAHFSYWPQVWPSKLPATCDITFRVNPHDKYDNWTIVGKITDSYLKVDDDGDRDCLDKFTVDNTTYCGEIGKDPQAIVPWKKLIWENVNSDIQASLYTPGHPGGDHTARVSFYYWKIKEPHIYKTPPAGKHLKGKTCNETFYKSSVELYNDYHGNISYQDNQHCVMSIYLAAGMNTVVINVRTFKLEYCPNCSCDYIELPDGTRLCGSPDAPAPQNSKAPELNYKYYFYVNDTSFDIIFHTDSTINDYGFVADVTTVPGVKTTSVPTVTTGGSCDEWSNDTMGTFTSPGFPQLYPYRSSCAYIIDLNNEKRNPLLISIKFDHFDVGSIYSCVENGFIFVTAFSPHLCGNRNERYRNISAGYEFQFVTRKERFLMRLVTDGRRHMSGFSLNFNVSQVKSPVQGVCMPMKEKCTRICKSGYAKDYRGCTVSCQCQDVFESGCYCNAIGALNSPPICIKGTNHCQCKPGYVGDRCDKCDHGYYYNQQYRTCNLCPASCSRDEYQSNSCHLDAGKPVCQKCPVGYTGPMCNQCERRYYRNTEGQCKKCNCNDREIPSANPYCLDGDGHCPGCLYNFAGYFCEKCKTGFTFNQGPGICEYQTPVPAPTTPAPKVTKAPSGPNIGLAVGITFLVLFILGGIAIGVYIYMKRVKSTPGFGHSRFGVNFHSNGQTLDSNYTNT